MFAFTLRVAFSMGTITTNYEFNVPMLLGTLGVYFFIIVDMCSNFRYSKIVVVPDLLSYLAKNIIATMSL